MGDQDFLLEALARATCAVFIKESRMKFREAGKVDRKSGGSPTIALCPRLKAIEKNHLRPTYAGANMGHPDRVG